MRDSCIPSCCFSAPYCGHHARFCEKFVNFERIFLLLLFEKSLQCAYILIALIFTCFLFVLFLFLGGLWGSLVHEKICEGVHLKVFKSITTVDYFFMVC